jgi:hypothetical protein
MVQPRRTRSCQRPWMTGPFAAIAWFMKPNSSSDGFVRRVRLSVAWYTLREYVNGALWVLPGVAGLAALAVGFAMSQVTVAPGSPLNRLAFQGTADDARALLITVSSTVVTVIALVLGLTVVALQLSSTQFSPRLLRNFLRDRGTQVVLSAFIATFVYSAAGLFTVGLEAGARTEDYPRLAVSGSILLLFVSLGMVVYFADHLAHSIQIDAINRLIERNTRRTIIQEEGVPIEEVPPEVPEWAVPLLGKNSGYIQTVHPQLLLPLAAEHGVTIGLRHRVGQHLVAGTVLAWVWTPSPDEPRPSAESFEGAVLSLTSELASSAPSNKTLGLASGSRPTLPARLSHQPSTTHTPRCRPSIISPSSTATSPSGRSAPRFSPARQARDVSSCPEAPSTIMFASSVRRSDATARVTSS